MEVCRDPLWNSSVSWDTSSPRLSSCLQSVLEILAGSLLPLLLLPWLFLLPGRNRGLQQTPRGGRRGLLLLLLRSLASFLFLATSLTLLLTQTPTPVAMELVATSLLCCSALLSCGVELLLLRARCHTSHLLSFHWILLLLLLLPQLLVVVQDLDQDNAPILPSILILLRLLSALLGLLLQLPPNLSVLPPDLAPQAEASSLSLLLFSWLSPLVWRGWRRPLLLPDLPSVTSEVEVQANSQVFLERAERQKQTSGRVSLWRLLLGCFGVAYLQVLVVLFQYILPTQGLTLFVARMFLVFCSPLLLQQIIRHVEHGEEPAWRGGLYCAGLFATSRSLPILSKTPIPTSHPTPHPSACRYCWTTTDSREWWWPLCR